MVVWGYIVYCVFLFIFCFFVCTVTDFSAAEKARGAKFCTHVGLLSGQVFSPFGEDWLAGSHGSGKKCDVIYGRHVRMFVVVA